MTTVNRRHFLMSSVALPVALKASALQSPNNTVRVAVVGFNGRGKAHIYAYLKMPNVEIAALCDVDQSVVDSGCKTIEAAGKKRPATYTDIRKVLDDKSIDAVSIATPNFHHTLQTIWAVQAGKDVLRREAGLVQHVRSAADHRGVAEIQPDRAGRHRRPGLAPRGEEEDQGRDHRRRLHGARPVSSSGATRSGAPRRNRCRRASPTICGPVRRRRSRSRATASTTTGTGSGTTATATSATRARIRCTRRASALGVKYPTKISSMGGHYMFDDDQETPNTQVATFEFEDGGKKKLLVFEVRHWISNNEAGIGERSAPTGGGAAQPLQTVGNIWYGSKGYLATSRDGWQTFMGPEQAPGPKSEAGAGYRRLRQLHRRRPQPQARGSARGGRGGRDLDDADSPGQHLVPHRPHVVFRSGQLHVQGRCGSDGDVHAESVPGAVYGSERRRHADGVKTAESCCCSLTTMSGIPLSHMEVADG